MRSTWWYWLTRSSTRAGNMCLKFKKPTVSCVVGLCGQVLLGGAGGVASLRRIQKLPHVRYRPVSEGYKETH